MRAVPEVATIGFLARVVATQVVGGAESLRAGTQRSRLGRRWEGTAGTGGVGRDDPPHGPGRKLLGGLADGAVLVRAARGNRVADAVAAPALADVLGLEQLGLGADGRAAGRNVGPGADALTARGEGAFQCL